MKILEQIAGVMQTDIQQEPHPSQDKLEAFQWVLEAMQAQAARQMILGQHHGEASAAPTVPMDTDGSAYVEGQPANANRPLQQTQGPPTVYGPKASNTRQQAATPMDQEPTQEVLTDLSEMLRNMQALLRHHLNKREGKSGRMD